MVKFERVTVALEDGSKKTYTIQVTAESEQFLQGYELNRDGEEVCGKGFDRRLHLIQKSLIAKRVLLKQNLMYGTLEKA
jgi:hypothetical protein